MLLQPFQWLWMPRLPRLPGFRIARTRSGQPTPRIPRGIPSRTGSVGRSKEDFGERTPVWVGLAQVSYRKNHERRGYFRGFFLSHVAPLLSPLSPALSFAPVLGLTTSSVVNEHSRLIFAIWSRQMPSRPISGTRARM